MKKPNQSRRRLTRSSKGDKDKEGFARLRLLAAEILRMWEMNELVPHPCWQLDTEIFDQLKAALANGEAEIEKSEPERGGEGPRNPADD